MSHTITTNALTTPGRTAVVSQLFRSCMRVIKSNPKLLLFPLVALALSLIGSLFFVPWSQIPHEAASLITTGDADHLWDFETTWEHSMTMTDYPSLALFNVLTTFISTFISVAFYHEIFHTLDGGVVSLRGSQQFARQRLRSIIRWSLFSGSLATTFDFLRNCVSGPTRIIVLPICLMSILAAAFVVPLIIRDDKASPLDLLSDSLLTLGATTSESIFGFVQIYFTVGIVLMVVSVAAAAGTFLLDHSLPQTFSQFRSITEWCALPFMWALYTATNIYCCVLYIYTTEGTVPEPFTPAMMDAGWKVKKASTA